MPGSKQQSQKAQNPVISVEMNICVYSVLCKGGQISSSNIWTKYIICKYQRGSYKFSPKCFSYECSFAHTQYQNNQLHLQLTSYWKTTEIKCGDKEGYCHKLSEWTMRPESLLYTSLSYSELHYIIEVFKMSIWKGFKPTHKIQMYPSLE